MFKLSSPCSPEDPISSILNHIDKHTATLLESKNSWYQVFYQEVVSVFPE